MPAPQTAGPARSLAGSSLALVAATGLLACRRPAGPPDVRAAAPDLTIVTSDRTRSSPTQRRVRVTVDMTLTNHLHDTKTKRYYFDHAFLAVLPGASATS